MKLKSRPLQVCDISQCQMREKWTNQTGETFFSHIFKELERMKEMEIYESFKFQIGMTAEARNKQSLKPKVSS